MKITETLLHQRLLSQSGITFHGIVIDTIDPRGLALTLVSAIDTSGNIIPRSDYEYPKETRELENVGQLMGVDVYTPPKLKMADRVDKEILSAVRNRRNQNLESLELNKALQEWCEVFENG